jgi:hypothetical protein
MKYFLLTFLIALTASVASSAQTLQIDPMYIGGTATFEVQNGSPNAAAVICYSMNGVGPFTLSNGITLDLSLPIKNLSPFALNSLGNGTLGPFPLPSNAVVGLQVWFQGVQLDMWANPIYSVTNMVPITVQNTPNNPPTAVDDSATTPAAILVSIDVMANDSDVDGDSISLFSVSAPTNGIAVINGGMIDYTPATGYSGIDTFTYIIEDTFGSQAAATVFIDIENQYSLVSWGRDNANQVSFTPTTNDFIQVEAGGNHSLALRLDGSLVSWGADDYGQVTDTPVGNDFTQVATGSAHSVALESDGSLVSWGYDGYGQVSYTPTTNNFVQVATSIIGHSVALRSDGSLVSWGYNGYNQVSDTPTNNDFIQVAAGYGHSVALRANGSLVSWGYDDYSAVSGTPTTNDFIQVAAGDQYSVALKSDGSLVSWGFNNYNQVLDTPAGNDFTHVSAGSYFSLALRLDGSLVSWGADNYGQVTDTPVGNDFTQVSAGGHHSVALKL